MTPNKLGPLPVDPVAFAEGVDRTADKLMSAKSMNKPKRYALHMRSGMPAMLEVENGPWIRYDDLSALTEERDKAQKELDEAVASMPSLSNRTKSQARELLGEVLRHVTDQERNASHGCVEVTNAVNVVEHLIADNAALLADRDRLAREVEELRADSVRLNKLQDRIAVDGWRALNDIYDQHGFTGDDLRKSIDISLSLH